MLDLKATREFQFPNGGHSIRKLYAELISLGDTPVKLNITKPSASGHFQVKWVENKHGVNATKLANKLATVGTRFTVINGKLEFYTDYRDIEANPEFYL